MDNYFKHYPLVVYGDKNTVSINMLSKIAFLKSLQKNFEVYHPYTIQEGDRADIIAYLYYGDPGYDWVVYYSNNIVDPYYDWYMNENTLKDYLTKKYGSVVAAKQQIKFFRSNYIEDDSIISTAAYAALSDNQKVFWSPMISTSGRVYSYERKKEDVQYETNVVKTISISITNNKEFSPNEYVYQQSGSLTVAAGTVVYSNTSTAVIKSVIGNMATGLPLKGYDSGAVANVTEINSTTNCIPLDIVNYFVPVSVYDYEVEQNEQKKNIRLIDSSYISSIEEQFKQLLSS
jgi:hypothetical protein